MIIFDSELLLPCKCGSKELFIYQNNPTYLRVFPVIIVTCVRCHRRAGGRQWKYITRDWNFLTSKDEITLSNTYPLIIMDNKSEYVRLRTNMFFDLRFIPVGTVIPKAEVPKKFLSKKYVEPVVDEQSPPSDEQPL